MPTFEQAYILGQEIQAVNDNPDHFNQAQQWLDAVADTIRDPILSFRFRRQLGTNVLSHLTAVAAIDAAEPEANIQVPPGAAAHDTYREHTAGFDTHAVVTTHLMLTEGHPFTPVYEHFGDLLAAHDEIAEKNANELRRQGKVLSPPLTPFKSRKEETLLCQFNENITMAQVVRSAMQLVLTTGALPEPKMITRQVFEDDGLEKLMSVSRANVQLFNHHTRGSKAAQRWYKENLKCETNTASKDWDAILQQFVEQGTLPDLAQDMALHLVAHKPVHLKSTKRGHCGGSYDVRPYEPGGAAAKREKAEAFFRERGIVLREGRFCAVRYQIVREFRVAEATIFSDPIHRAAMEEIARSVLRNMRST